MLKMLKVPHNIENQLSCKSVARGYKFLSVLTLPKLNFFKIFIYNLAKKLLKILKMHRNLFTFIYPFLNLFWIKISQL